MSTVTGIYLNVTTTLDFTTSEAVTLIPYNTSQSSITATVIGTNTQEAVNVPAGIYKVLTNDPIQIKPSSGENITTFESTNVKDPTPDPPGFADTNHMYTDKASLCTFFVRPDGRSLAFPSSAR